MEDIKRIASAEAVNADAWSRSVTLRLGFVVAAFAVARHGDRIVAAAAIMAAQGPRDRGGPSLIAPPDFVGRR